MWTSAVKSGERRAAAMKKPPFCICKTGVFRLCPGRDAGDVMNTGAQGYGFPPCPSVPDAFVPAFQICHIRDWKLSSGAMKLI